MASKEEIYDKHVYPLVQQIVGICAAHGIAIACHFLLNQETGLTVSTQLPDDKVGFQNVLNDEGVYVDNSNPAPDATGRGKAGDAADTEIEALKNEYLSQRS